MSGPDLEPGTRSEPDLHPALLALLPLIGRWRGPGVGTDPGRRGGGDGSASGDYPFAQEVHFASDGRDVLSYSSRTWLLDPSGRPQAPGPAEVGWWRARPDDTLEVVVATDDGVLELYYGQVRGLQFELGTDAVVRAPSAGPVASLHRLYAVVDGDLAYAVDVSRAGEPATPRMSARLTRG